MIQEKKITATKEELTELETVYINIKKKLKEILDIEKSIATKMNYKISF